MYLPTSFTDDRVAGALIELVAKSTFKSNVLGTIFIPAEDLLSFNEKETWLVLYVWFLVHPS